MQTDIDWVRVRLAHAREACPLITEAVSDRVEILLKGQLSDHLLTQGELTATAKALLADMVSTPEKAEKE